MRPDGWLKRLHPERIPAPGVALYTLATRSQAFQRHYTLIAADIRARTRGSVLDLGTGPGWLLLRLDQLGPPARLVGIDLSRPMLARAARTLARVRSGAEIELVEANASRLPFEDGSFDAVVSSGSLHHWKDPLAALAEARRVLRPGGVALIYDLITDVPRAVRDRAARDFGRLPMLLLWLHAFEEPFHSRAGLEEIARQSVFGSGTTRFVGVMCCLEMAKP
ncbi:MAG: class I SAM-dependent methyltransferase [Acidobacteria bacterium]|nr:class I SAM-dependent methyltransferase [Acidobacteriota bacterium]